MVTFHLQHNLDAYIHTICIYSIIYSIIYRQNAVLSIHLEHLYKHIEKTKCYSFICSIIYENKMLPFFLLHYLNRERSQCCSYSIMYRGHNDFILFQHYLEIECSAASVWGFFKCRDPLQISPTEIIGLQVPVYKENTTLTRRSIV